MLVAYLGFGWHAVSIWGIPQMDVNLMGKTRQNRFRLRID